MRISGFQVLCAAFLSVVSAPFASAQTVLGQWNANNRATSALYLGTTSGTNAASGVAAGFGQGNPAAPLSSVITNGTLADPGTVVGSTNVNYSFIVNPPLTTAAENTIGISFKVPTTGMAPGEAVRLSWSQTVGFRSSRYWQLLATTDGTNYSPVPTGTGSSITTTVNGFSGAAAPFTPISGTASVTVSNTGLIDFRTISGNSLVPTSTTTTAIDPFYAGFVDNIQFTLPTGQNFENNANFGFAIVGAFDPAYEGTDGAFGLVSSVAGTATADATNGYNRSAGSGGSMRLDLVTVSAVPEPGSLAVLGGAAILAAGVVRRRIAASRAR
jgi:hypothetical protein